MTDLPKWQAKGYAYISGNVILRTRREEFRKGHPEILDSPARRSLSPGRADPPPGPPHGADADKCAEFMTIAQYCLGFLSAVMLFIPL